MIRLKQVRAIRQANLAIIEIAAGRLKMPRVLIAGCGYVGAPRPGDCRGRMGGHWLDEKRTIG